MGARNDSILHNRIALLTEGAPQCRGMSGAEIEPRLASLSDTEIVLNFAQAMGVLYPRMRRVFAHCYDPYDSVVEPLFQALVYETFAGKYGVPTPRSRCLTYDAVLSATPACIHIRVVPRMSPVYAVVAGQDVVVPSKLLQRSAFVFKAFGDGKHCLTGGEDLTSDYNVSFNLTEVQIVASDTLAPHAQGIQLMWLENTQVDYAFMTA